jgi:hypothetical protein
VEIEYGTSSELECALVLDMLDIFARRLEEGQLQSIRGFPRSFIVFVTQSQILRAVVILETNHEIYKLQLESWHAKLHVSGLTLFVNSVRPLQYSCKV